MERMERLACVLRALGLDWQRPVDTFEKRLKMQKMVYLLEILGEDVGYGFNWYKRGPYSPDLTRDAYELQDRGGIDGSIESKVVGAGSSERVATMLELERSLLKVRKNLDEPGLWELCGSIAYLATTFAYPDDRLKRILAARKPDFNPPPAEFDDMLALLRRHRIIH